MQKLNLKLYVTNLLREMKHFIYRLHRIFFVSHNNSIYSHSSRSMWYAYTETRLRNDAMNVLRVVWLIVSLPIPFVFCLMRPSGKLLPLFVNILVQRNDSGISFAVSIQMSGQVVHVQYIHIYKYTYIGLYIYVYTYMYTYIFIYVRADTSFLIWIGPVSCHGCRYRKGRSYNVGPITISVDMFSRSLLSLYMA